ncbi:MAG: tripartite tricarboxylate transporter substrate-binding protein [Beijerinckiaceae bacterium]|nr:tripartite tricarboxylate transporter substrate-binding protein [Beijerinckiaceae bacterium]
MMLRFNRFYSVLGLLAVVIAAISLARESAAQDYYKGRQITIIVGNPAGSGFDAYARLLARHMGRHIPGQPTFVVQNMPGAGSVTAAQYLMNVAPRDGTTIGIVVPGAIFDPLIDGEAKFRYSPHRFLYLGSADSGTRVCFTSKQSGVRTLADARERKVVVASTAPQSAATDYALMMNALAGTKFEVVMGYKGPADLILATERGEAQGVCALDSGTIATIKPDWLATNAFNLLVQAGLKSSADVPAPSMWEFIKGSNREVAELIVSQQEFSRPFIAPPDTPRQQAEMLRSAFADTMKDVELASEAKKMRIGINFKNGEEITEIVRKLYSSSPDLITRARQILRP